MNRNFTSLIAIIIAATTLAITLIGCAPAEPAATITPEPSVTPEPTNTSPPQPTDTPVPTEAPTEPEPNAYERAKRFEGEWVGDWHNTTYDTTGSANMTVTVNEDGTFEVVVDLGGSVFGIGDPPPIPFSGSYTDTSGEFSVFDDPTMGSLSFEIDDEGNLSGGSDNLLLSTGTIEITGTINAEEINLHYALALPNGVQAEGDVTMIHEE